MPHDASGKLSNSARLLFASSVLCFAASLALPAINKHTGIACLIWGWASVLSLINFSWLANPLLWMTAYFTLAKRRDAALLWSVVCTLLIASSLMFNKFTWWDTGSGTEYRTIYTFGIGYWLWLATPLLLLMANVVGGPRSPKVPH
jgi:hypothetical protein